MYTARETINFLERETVPAISTIDVHQQKDTNRKHFETKGVFIAT